jgi:tetratricopeptide (TPR) repeat protein
MGTIPPAPPGPADPSPTAAHETLPQLATPTFGRDQAVEDLLALLGRQDVRMVTLTGPGGVGKTRLALLAAHAAAGRYADGARWVDLDGLPPGGDVAAAIVQALGLERRSGVTHEHMLMGDLGGRELLLVLDNFEHVLGSALLVSELRRRCPRLTILVTSRESRDLGVEPLALVPGGETVTADVVENTAASAMFLAAARRRDHRLALHAGDPAAVARISTRLEAARTALELYRQVGDDVGISSALSAAACETGSIGDPIEQLSLAREAVRFAERAGDERALARALAEQAWSAGGEESATALTRAASVMERLGLERALFHLYCNVGYRELTEGRIDAALGVLSKARFVAEQLGAPLSLAMVLSNLGLCEVISGRATRAAEHLRQKIEIEVAQSWYLEVCETLVGLAGVAALYEQDEVAGRLLGASATAGYPREISIGWFSTSLTGSASPPRVPGSAPPRGIRPTRPGAHGRRSVLPPTRWSGP